VTPGKIGIVFGAAAALAVLAGIATAFLIKGL
jgi:hypothetical protein